MKIQLSNQARWYLTGSFPVYDKETYYGAKNRPEPKAMQELVYNGLVEVKEDKYLKCKVWNLTSLGQAYKLNPE